MIQKTSVVDIHKKQGKRPMFDIYAGRAVKGTEFTENSKWANPYLTLPEYEKYIKEKIKKNPEYYDLEELRGKKIGCWCVTTDKIEPLICHVQILLKILRKVNWNEITIIVTKKIDPETIIWYPEIGDLCSRSYPGHKKGCPNVEKCQRLNIPDFGIINRYGDYNYYYLIYIKFNFRKYKRLRMNQGEWWNVGKRASCLLYWQSTLKSLLSKYINLLNLDRTCYVLACGSGMKLKHQERVGSMENSCINVFSTMKLNGIKMEVKPKDIIYLVNLLCSKNKIIMR